MASKGHGLSFPSDPLAALRALQDLDAAAAPPAVAPPPIPERGEPGPPTSPAPGSEVSGATGSAGAKRPSARRGRGNPESEASRLQDAHDPLLEAVRELLDRPYAGERTKGPVTVSTVKIPTEVWERLGWVAALTGRTKQDLIAEALKAYFRDALKGR